MSDRAAISRGDVIIAEMAIGHGREIRKRRPFVIVSPDDINAVRFTYLIAPLTTGDHPYHYRVPCEFRGRRGHVVLDQLFTIDAQRVGEPVGQLAAASLRATLSRLREMFAE